LRVREAARLGFDRCYLPAGCLKAVDAPPGMELRGVRSVEQALDEVFA
jgi:DNA repair protein RadA/Sms